MPTAAFHTLGCKVNQYDTQAMLECFVRAGYEIRPFTERADVYVVNTCTVTGTGDRKSMNAVRRAQRLNPEADIVIAGCLAQRDGEKLLDTGARLIIGASRRGEVVELLRQAREEGRQIVAVQKDILRVPFENLTVSGDMDRTRAVIKIQEGCDRYCTYCIIPSVRGGIRSREPADIRAEAIRLSIAGFQDQRRFCQAASQEESKGDSESRKETAGAGNAPRMVPCAPRHPGNMSRRVLSR